MQRALRGGGVERALWRRGARRGPATQRARHGGGGEAALWQAAHAGGARAACGPAPTIVTTRRVRVPGDAGAGQRVRRVGRRGCPAKHAGGRVWAGRCGGVDVVIVREGWRRSPCRAARINSSAAQMTENTTSQPMRGPPATSTRAYQPSLKAGLRQARVSGVTPDHGGPARCDRLRPPARTATVERLVPACPMPHLQRRHCAFCQPR